ncbi:hypothetical protein [Pseudactinotalea terrae]|uniref:hypothetical protein n=1 Tax=Pseudactinotalea terrae TaxID=1743262 RepID=UPI0012E22061|nr:hypothetical protein [Pseudactinotalea terrae]
MVGSAIIAIVAILTLAFLGPQDDTTDGSSERMIIWIDDEANQERTQGAPQQQVVNGWTSNALLDLISTQLDEPHDDRPAILLALGVILLGLSVATTSPRAVAVRS